jgi:hypothetical protein
MTTYHLKLQEVQIARYRFLEKEVTDPLAASLLHCIIEELEAHLARLLPCGDPHRSERHSPDEIDSAKDNHWTGKTA